MEEKEEEDDKKDKKKAKLAQQTTKLKTQLDQHDLKGILNANDTSNMVDKNQNDNLSTDVMSVPNTALRVLESEESLLKKALKEELTERRDAVQTKFRISELANIGTPKSVSGTLPTTVESIVKGRAQELYSHGLKHMSKDEYVEAITCFSKACNLDPEFKECYVYKGEAFMKLCDFQSAILNYKKACILQPESDELFSRLAFLFFLRGQCHFDNKNFVDALDCFSKAAEIRPDVWTYHTRSMACLAAQHKHGECFGLVNQRLEVEKNNPDLFVIRARLHKLFGNSTLAYYDAKDALQLDANHEEALTLIAELEGRARDYHEQAKKMDLQGKTWECLTKISTAIETDPTVGEYHSYRASLHRRNMDFNAAVDDLLVALDKSDHDESHPVHKEAHRQLLLTYNDFAVECFRKGFFEEAITLLNKAIKHEKNEKSLYVNRGDCFYQTHELHFALSDYLQSLELSPADQGILLRLSILYNDLAIYEYQKRRYLQAEEFFSTAIEYKPQIPSYYVSRARARYMLEDLDSARVDVISALHLNIDQKQVAPLFSRLFPGKYQSEVVESEFGVLVKEALHSVIEDISIKRASDKGDTTPSIGCKKEPLPSISSPAKEKVQLHLRECMEAEDLSINIILGKKKVNELVEAVIQSRQELTSAEPCVDNKTSQRAIGATVWTSSSPENILHQKQKSRQSRK